MKTVLSYTKHSISWIFFPSTENSNDSISVTKWSEYIFLIVIISYKDVKPLTPKGIQCMKELGTEIQSDPPPQKKTEVFQVRIAKHE